MTRKLVVLVPSENCNPLHPGKDEISEDVLWAEL